MNRHTITDRATRFDRITKSEARKLLKLAAGIANAEWDKQKHAVDRKIAAEHIAEALQYSRFILEV